MQLKDIAGDLPITPQDGGVPIRGLTADSRQVKPDFLFAALKGAKADGTAFVKAAVEAGAAAVLVGEDADIEAVRANAAGHPVIVSEDPRRTLALMAAKFYGHQPDVMVAVTGTSGKTSVAVFVRQIFSACGFEAASLGTIGTVTSRGEIYGGLTTPDPVNLHRDLARLSDDGITHAAMEASSHGLDQRRLDGVELKAAGFTNLGRDHLDYHPDVESYLQAKLRLFDTVLPDDGIVVLEPSAPYADRVIDVARSRGQTILTVGKGGEALGLEDNRQEGFDQILTLSTPDGMREVRLPLAGRFQASNALIAAGLAIAAGVPRDDALKALENLEGATGRLERVGVKANGALVVVDYAHKPDALENALQALRPFTSGRLFVVIGAGGDRDPGKRPLMGKASFDNADVVIVTDDNPRSEEPAKIREAVMEGAPGAIEIADRGEAISTAISLLEEGDVLCVAGKGHETGQIVGETVLEFSDHEAIGKALAREADGMDKGMNEAAAAADIGEGLEHTPQNRDRISRQEYAQDIDAGANSDHESDPAFSTSALAAEAPQTDKEAERALSIGDDELKAIFGEIVQKASKGGKPEPVGEGAAATDEPLVWEAEKPDALPEETDQSSSDLVDFSAMEAELFGEIDATGQPDTEREESADATADAEEASVDDGVRPIEEDVLPEAEVDNNAESHRDNADAADAEAAGQDEAPVLRADEALESALSGADEAPPEREAGASEEPVDPFDVPVVADHADTGALWTLKEFLNAVGGIAVGDPAPEVTGISIDSRTIEPGEAFFAIDGDRFDGHDFVRDAIKAGAAIAVVSHKKIEEMPRGGPIVAVADPLEALRRLARAARQRTRAQIVAVTGSVGKTGTKEMLRLALSRSGRTHASVASFNNHWGVPLTLARMPADTDFGVFEIGMNHAGEITPLTQMVRPHVAIITTVQPVHLEFFGSVEKIAEAKAEIFAGLEPDGIAILNRDNDQFDLLQFHARMAGVRTICTFGVDQPANAKADKISSQTGCTCISATVLGEEITYKVGAPGLHYVKNSLAVLSAAKLVGADLALAGLALTDMRAPKGRGAQTKLTLPDGALTLIDESYNANPASMRAALRLLGETPVKRPGRRIAVLGDMRELGEMSDALHAELRDPIVDAEVDTVYCAGPHMHALWETLPAAMRGAYSEDAGGLRPLLLGDMRNGDVVMIKGSLGTKMGPLVEALMKEFPAADEAAE
ncbi:UDP-N-acetylmuramoylalanyl-D-glutamyl-2,6-diaminopimelate--D-alanyl-D-alanine ligase [Hongsoonwoonella zoysiae]|uniref:UDP-N-acetylmuramoylalanyl-D-glutamyl-2, 6-diaminopimelate--D-alanyl-D-alanine ligase n=1 Tax=Hongsoonwoonella zoysiae TaxID=2821844 RepID=UPI001FE47A0C|nr:UDP-N-acetylmuramoylalanyl-D-glutamyl-2,6-diaminopimelate--D-alanyl-D-alanine ligase [Hongsoonwoonella zoysiae]